MVLPRRQLLNRSTRRGLWAVLAAAVLAACMIFHAIFPPSFVGPPLTSPAPPLKDSNKDESSVNNLWLHLQMNTRKTQEYYKKHANLYSNRADFGGAKRLFSLIKQVGLDQKESVVLVGGTNDGQSSMNILNQCPSLSLYGFEIQVKHFEIAKNEFERSNFASATAINLGWDEHAAEGVGIGGSGSKGGLFDPKGQRGWIQQNNTATTVRLDEWTSAHAIDQVLYIIIDTEGHEPKVIRGMALDKVTNQKRFPLFQYELGGTWAEKDTRHGNDKWNQYLTAKHLLKCGYNLFHIGEKEWLSIDASFFSETDNPALSDEGLGPYVQGNVMAMHSQFTPSKLASKILEHVVVIK
jgi:FkbM family methyltransferase